MDFIDYYKILGLTPKATEAEIKAAYRKGARKFHPDLNPNNAEAKVNFQRINEANSVLSDPVKRKKYDKYGKDWEQGEAFERANQSKSSRNRSQGDSQSGADFSDFFESMFGGHSGGGTQSRFRGEDFRATLQLPLLDAYKTHQQIVSVNGKDIRITIPAGIENGQTIRINGHGGHGINGGPNGDLYITFSILEQAGFKRLGNDLYTTKELDIYTAVLGGDAFIDTLLGKVKLKVKPETQNGDKVKLRAKGFPIYKKEGEFGDLFVTYSIKIPTNLTDKQRELFTELSKT